MTDIDFYILAAQHLDERTNFACRLAEKAYRSNCKVCIHVDSEADARALDDAMWTFKAESFLPHCVISDDMPECAIHISYGSQQPPCYDVLINLAQDIPSSFTRYKRTLEVVIQNDGILASTRKHYKHYKDRGYAINNYDMRIA